MLEVVVQYAVQRSSPEVCQAVRSTEIINTDFRRSSPDLGQTVGLTELYGKSPT